MTNLAQQIHTNLGVDDAAFTKQLKGTQSWGELAIIEDKVRDQIAASATMTRDVMHLCSSEGVVTPELRALTQGVMRDLKEFADRLAVQMAKRNGRTNAVNGPNEYTDYISVGLELSSLSESLQVVVGATLMELTEFQQLANDKIRAREAAEAEATAVIDVEYKNVAGTEVGDAATDVEWTPVGIPGLEGGGIDQQGLHGQWEESKNQAAPE